MKSTKNVLITGVALVIALFASVQVNAMEPERKECPYLDEETKQVLKFMIGVRKSRAVRFCDPKSAEFNPNFDSHKNNKELKLYETILYGNQYFTYGDVAYMDPQALELKLKK
jgi:hypothetical protein